MDDVTREASARFAAIYQAEFRTMYNLAFALLSDRDEAEDVVQEAFISVARIVDDIDNVQAYLRVTVTNCCRRSIRKKARAQQVLLQRRLDSPSLIEQTDFDFSSALMQLTHRRRSAIVLRYLNGLSDSEIALILGCSTSTVRSLVHRALVQLKKELT